jgi:hypothetical protein
MDAERQFVPFVPQPDRHRGVTAGVFGRVLDRFEAAQVHRVLDVGRARPDVPGRDLDRDPADLALGPQGVNEPPRGKQRR